jgi:excisionase family DNA binding protein
MERRRISDRRAKYSAPIRKASAEPAWFTVSQLCQRWQLGRKTIYRFIDSGLLPAWMPSTHLYRVAVADVLRFEVRNRLPPK